MEIEDDGASIMMILVYCGIYKVRFPLKTAEGAALSEVRAQGKVLGIWGISSYSLARRERAARRMYVLLEEDAMQHQ
jgi:hypothetical protein